MKLIQDLKRLGKVFLALMHQLLVLLFMESSIRTVCTIPIRTYSYFFLVCKFYNSGLQIMLLTADRIRFMGSAYIGRF